MDPIYQHFLKFRAHKIYMTDCVSHDPVVSVTHPLSYGVYFMSKQLMISAFLLVTLNFSSHAYIADGSEVLSDNERITRNAMVIFKLEDKIRELENKLKTFETNQNKIIKIQYDSKEAMDKLYSEQKLEKENK